jgi:G3E family GTPase
MIKVDLITGFLGAGKTTFLLKYAKYLMSQGLKIGILVYDHGAVNVDMPFLKELRGEQCELEMLAGACDADCHRRRFRTKLISMGMSGYERVIIEPSGVFDVDEYFDTLNESPLDRWYEAGSVITVVDAKLGENYTEEEDFFLASQAASAGCILLSRVQLATAEDIEKTVLHLEKAEKRIHCSFPVRSCVLRKDWADLTEEDFAGLMNCGCRHPDYVKTIAGRELEFQSLSFLNPELTRDELEKKITELFRDRKYGNIIRVKGFFDEGGRWYQVNATEGEVRIEKAPESRGAIIIIGSGLNEENISILMTGKPPEHRIL